MIDARAVIKKDMLNLPKDFLIDRQGKSNLQREHVVPLVELEFETKIVRSLVVQSKRFILLFCLKLEATQRINCCGMWAKILNTSDIPLDHIII